MDAKNHANDLIIGKEDYLKLNCHALDRAYVRKINKRKPTKVSKYVVFVRAK